MFKFLRNLLIPMTAKPHVPIPANGVDYRGKVVLAPMVRSSELPCRLLALKYGADLVWGPETIDRAMIGTTRRINPRNSMVEFTRLPSNGGRSDSPLKESVIYRIDPAREKGKLIYQIGTASPELAVRAAQLVAADVAGIDVNAGCPKSFSTTGGMGAALLQTPEKLASILEALVREIGNVYQIGISVKIRLLSDPERTRALVTRLCATGITGLTIHCRTTPMRPRERALREQLPMIASVCRDAGVACVVNGDVVSRDHGLELMKEYNVDGAMIATAAEANSSCFRSAAEGGLLPWREVVHTFMQGALECENRWGNTKFTLNILIPGKDKVYKHAKQSKGYEECCTALGLVDLLPAARQVDQILGCTWSLSSSVDKKSPAVQKAMETNDSAKAAGTSSTAATSPTKSKPNLSNGTGPIRRHSSPKPFAETPVDLSIAGTTETTAPAANAVSA
ncbi:hypothetical protein AJ80_02123 [Polytolypa hystricis UAMH7299]|uniref:DUS-like FMN-binding domain-containing protein n=1 Tax=Polytolypa hystricis (strain UAMH7299) TaxID=1447883 RepID=A0A2B7YIF3_POLH7|nr:hypothetical protein AJ80_02123 [Polytolypa hystricis UAMH7299]